MKACRTLVGHFSHSSQAAKKLKEKQADLQRQLGVLQDVSTRWWSTYTMTERLMFLKIYFDLMEREGSLSCNLTESQWVITGLVRDVLKPFMLAQKVLEGEKYVTLSFVPGIVHGIRNGLVNIENNPEIPESVKSLSLKMLDDFVKRWGSGDDNTVFTENETEGYQRRLKGFSKLTMMAAACDPRTKMLRGIPETDRGLLWNYIRDKMLEIAHGDESAPVTSSGVLHQYIACENSEPDYYDVLMEDVQFDVDRDILPDISLEDKVTAELAHYRALPVLPGKKTDAAGKIVHVNPLLWWRDQQEKLPIMSKLARRVLCIPATSAPSERVFSAAGLTIAHRRASLNAENAAALIFLHDSWSEIEKMEKESEASKKKNISNY
jgi:zinc finger BED domain-containing protein 1 (E3 SUMO-protein ligase ZBED1)